jgi:Amt family ammonium transporter
MLAGVGADTLFGSIPEVSLRLPVHLRRHHAGPDLGASPNACVSRRCCFSPPFWLIVVAAPICHMTWGGAGGHFADLGVFDFAGGIVVHITAGIAALVACIVIAPGLPEDPMPPHNPTTCASRDRHAWSA